MQTPKPNVFQAGIAPSFQAADRRENSLVRQEQFGSEPMIDGLPQAEIG
jgi:hypothetical protein